MCVCARVRGAGDRGADKVKGILKRENVREKSDRGRWRQINEKGEIKGGERLTKCWRQRKE